MFVIHLKVIYLYIFRGFQYGLRLLKIAPKINCFCKDFIMKD